MYSVGVVCNTFPVAPSFTDTDTARSEALAQAVLDATSERERTEYLFELYHRMQAPLAP